MNQLDNNTRDLVASLGRSAAGIVPFAGAFLSEVVSELIPNQRIDRIAKFCQELDSRLSSLEESDLRDSLNNNEGLLLLEDGFHLAARSSSDARHAYIAMVVANGLSDKEADMERQRYLLNILSDLNNEEILWLRFFACRTFGGDTEFRNKHKNLFQSVRPNLRSSEEDLDRSGLQASYKNHLIRLGLVEEKFSFDSKTGLPQYDRLTGKPKINRTSITRLGRILLSNLDLMPAE